MIISIFNKPIGKTLSKTILNTFSQDEKTFYHGNNSFRLKNDHTDNNRKDYVEQYSNYYRIN